MCDAITQYPAVLAKRSSSLTTQDVFDRTLTNNLREGFPIGLRNGELSGCVRPLWGEWGIFEGTRWQP
ncbi:hypothetical protein D3C80_1884010 [compost metagenome]